MANEQANEHMSVTQVAAEATRAALQAIAAANVIKSTRQKSTK